MTEKFRGRFTVSVDSKGRISWPSKWRQSSLLKNEIVVTNSFYKGLPFLDVYSLSKWQSLEKKIDQLPELKPEVQSFQRFFLSGGTPTEIDGQGRSLLPYELRHFAKLKSEVVLVGMGDRFEIWDARLWSKVFSEFKDDFESVMQKVADFVDASRGED